MANKKISDSIKDDLQPFLDSFTGILLAGLVKDNIIQKIKNPKNNEEEAYELIREIKETISTDKFTQKENNIVKDFLDFRELVMGVYRNLKYENADNTEKIPLSKLIETFEKRKVFQMPGQNIVRLKDIFDKGQRLLEDKVIEQDAVKIFREQNLNFPRYIFSLLEFYAKEKVKEHFPSFNFNNKIKSGTNNLHTDIDFIGHNKYEDKQDLLFDIKIRKKILSTLKENLFKCYEALIKYNKQSKKENCFVLITYTDENITDEKWDYRFKQNLEELFPNYLDKIFFVPVYIGYLHLIDERLKELNNRIAQSTTSPVNFIFFNQTPPNGFPYIDDHYYNETLNLKKSGYEISITPQSHIEHWRCGLKFSRDRVFPSREQRHINNYPIFHIEKNKDSLQINISYYNETGNLSFAQPTRINNYSEDPLIIKVFYENDTAVVDVLDKNKKTIIKSPVTISGFQWCKLFAWGDNRNKFEILAKIIEK